EELEDREIDVRMKAHAALERADGRAVLHPPTTIHMGFALIVDPGDAELDDPLGLDQAIEQALLRITRIGSDEGPDAAHHLMDRLQELRLIRIAPLHSFQ